MTNTATAPRPTAPSVSVVDTTEEMLQQGYRLMQVARFGELRFRAEVRWDVHEFQSFASVSVLSVDRKWTHLVSMPTNDWYSATASFYEPVKPGPYAQLNWICAALFARAAKIMA